MRRRNFIAGLASTTENAREKNREGSETQRGRDAAKGF
jgi:hypothetical protein